MAEVFKFQLGCCCEVTRDCNVVFDNAFNATTDSVPPDATAVCPGGPFPKVGSPTVLNDVWWTMVTGACVVSPSSTPDVHEPCTGATGGQSSIKIDAAYPNQTILLNANPVQKSSFKLAADFYPRHTGDTLQVFIDYLDDCNHTVIEFVANDHHPEVGVYRIVSGVRTKLRRRMNISGTDTGGGVFTNEGFYFNLAVKTCPGIKISVSLCRSTLLVRIGPATNGDDGTSPNGASTAFGTLNYDFDWSGTHNNPEDLGGGYPTPSDNIGYRPLTISVGTETGGAYNMTRAKWGLGGIVGPAGDYFTIGVVKVSNTDTIRARDLLNGFDCGGGVLSCAPDYLCNGLLTEYPVQLRAHSQGLSCGPKGRLWFDCVTTGTTYTDCSSDPGGDYQLVSQVICSNFGDVATGTDFTVDWTPYNFGGTRLLCEYYSGHNGNAVADSNPAYKHTYVYCTIFGTDEDVATGHEGFVALSGGISTGGLSAGYGQDDNVTAPHHNLNGYPTMPVDFPAFWKPVDVIGKTMRNQGIIGSPADEGCLWENQEIVLLEFIYEASD